MTAALNAAAIGRYRADPVAFVNECLLEPATGKPYVLLEAEKVFLRHAFQLDKRGKLRFPLLIYSAPKKSGKTEFGGIFVVTLIVLFGERFAEGYCIANDLEQATSRVFEVCKRLVAASPLLKRATKVLADKILFTATGAMIIPVAGDYTGAAGAHPAISVHDEIWGSTTERQRRLWDEFIPVPTRQISCRLIVSHAGFYDSELLHELYQRGLRQSKVGTDLYAGDGMLMFWSHTPIAPWQDEDWLADMRRSLRPHQFMRMAENRFVSTQDTFIPMEWYDRAVDENLTPLTIARSLPAFVAVDASVNKDSTGILALTYDRDREDIRTVWHRIFTPVNGAEIDFELVYTTIGTLCNRFDVQKVVYDPFQMEAVAQRLVRQGVPMEKLKQTPENLTAFGSCLYDLLKSKKLRFYPDEDIRLAMSRCVATETPRGWKISKEKASHHIDIIVALAMACHAALEGQLVPQHFTEKAIENMKTIMTSGRMHSSRGWVPADERAARMEARIGERRFAQMQRGRFRF